MISDYFKEVEQRIKDTEIVADKSIDFREFSTIDGMLRGRLLFVDGSMLEFMEYLHEDIVDYPSLLGHFFYMARNSMFHMFARRLGLDLL